MTVQIEADDVNDAHTKAQEHGRQLLKSHGLVGHVSTISFKEVGLELPPTQIIQG
jgi:hypothetical protein